MLQFTSNPVQLSGELGTGNADNIRQAERTHCELGAGLRQRGASGVTVAILDLSTHGFRASTHLDLQKDADVWLKLPGLEPLHARVAWANGHFIGCRFEKPLHPAVLQMVVGR